MPLLPPLHDLPFFWRAIVSFIERVLLISETGLGRTDRRLLTGRRRLIR
jgi:hypothetical protein